MRQVFRLMGMPDKMIAFDELPSSLVEGFELFDCRRLPRHWKEFIGEREQKIRVKPELNPITRQMETFPPLIEKGHYVYLVDSELGPDRERWDAVCSYVARNAPKEFRLLDKISDMAKPMAADAHSELTLEPEDVVVIPIVKVEEPVVAQPGAPMIDKSEPEVFQCDKCEKSYSSKQAIRMHRMKAHPEKKE